MAIFSWIGAAIAGALFAGSTLAASVIAGGLAFAARLGFSYLNRPKKRSYSAVQAETQFGGDVPVGTLYGIGKMKGQRTFYAKWGKGNQDNAEVFVLANGWCDGLEPYVYFFGEKHVLIERPIVGNEVAHFGVEDFLKGDDHLFSIRFYDGRPGQLVDQKLVDDTASLGQTWKSTSVNAGQAYVIVERRFNGDKFEKGKPDIEFVLRGLREYDPRKDSIIAGGSGPQRLDDPATWVHTRNPAVHRLNYQIGLRALISGRTLIGEGKSLGQIDLTTYFLSMNVCDTLRLDDKPTYQCSLYVNGDDDHTEVLREFDDAMAGFGLNRRGLSGVIPGAPQIPVMEITADDIPADRAKEVQFRNSAFERYNHMSGQFMSIEGMWNPESLKPVYVNADIAIDGRNRQTSNDFLQVTDPDIAQYLLNIRYRQNRKGGTATLPVSRRVGLKVQEGEWVTWRGVTWMITEWRLDEQFRITLKLSETGADIYDDDDIEPGPVIIPPAKPLNPSILSTIENFTVEVGLITSQGGEEVPCLQFKWTPPDDPSITAIRIFYRKNDESEELQCTSNRPGVGMFRTTDGVVSETRYIARATITTVPDRLKTFTPWMMTNDPTGRSAILDGAINELKLADRAVKTLKIALDAVKAELIANDAVIASKIANAAITTAKFAAGIEPVSIIPGTTVPTTKTTEVVMVDGKLYRWNGTAYKAEIDAADIAGTLLNAQIESLAASKITGTLIASQIANAAITTAKFANGIEPVTIIAGSTVPTTKSTEAIMVNGKLYRWDGTAYKANVDATDIAGTLTNAQVESLAASKITGTLIASQIANAAITTAKFAAGIEPVSIIAGSTVPTTKTTEVVIVSGKLYRWSGTAYKAEVDATDIAGEITSAQIAALDAVKVTGQIAGTQISDNAISSPKLAAGSVIAGKLAVGAVLAASIASGAVTTAKLDALAVTAEKLAVDSVVAGKVAAGAINAREIAAGAVSASKMFVGDSSNVYPDFDMVDPDFYFPLPSGVTYSFSGTSGSINGQKALIISSSDTVTHNVASNWFVVNQNADYYFEGVAYSDQGGSPTVYVQLATLDASGTPTVTSAPALITSALTAKQSSSFTTGANEKRARLLFRNNANSAGRVIFSAPIIRRKAMGELIVDGSVIAIKIASGAITTAKIAAGAVVASTIASGAVTTAKLDALAVTAEKLAVDSVIAGKVAAGAINAREIAAGAVTASKMFVGDTSNVFPDFDMADPDFYAGSSGVVYSIGGTGISYNGANQMTVHPSASSNQNVFSKFFTVNQGAEYYLEAVCRASGGGDPEILVSLASVDAAGVYTTTRLLSLIAGGVNGKQTGSFETTSVETKARLVFRNRAGATAPVYFSAPVVRRKAMGELIVDGSIIALKLASGAVTTAKLAAGAVVASTIASGAVTTAKLDALAVTAEKLAVDSVVAGKVAAGAINAREIAAAAIVASKLALGNFTNMVPDSEFQDAEAWELSTGGTITTSTTSFGDGAKGMLWTSTVLDNGTTSAFLVGRTIGFVPVIAGRQYLYKHSCRRYSAGSAIVRMAFYWYDSAGALVSSAASSWSTVTTTTPQAFSGTVIVPSGASQVRIGLQIRGDSTSGVIFRSIGFNEMNAGELIVDGTIYSNALATNAVTTAKIAAGAVTAIELGAGAVTAIKIQAGAVTAEKINVANLAALSANFGNATFSGYAQSANGKMKLDFTAGTIEIFS